MRSRLAGCRGGWPCHGRAIPRPAGRATNRNTIRTCRPSGLPAYRSRDAARRLSASSSRRTAANNTRGNWIWTTSNKNDVAQAQMRMVKEFGAMGVIEARLGVTGDPELPEVMLVENVPPAVIDRLTAAGIGVQLAPAADPVVRAGWEDQEQLEAFRSV